MWRERILAARERGCFTDKDRNDATGWSGWPKRGAYSQCAVGEQADKYGAALLFSHPDIRAGVLDLGMKILGAGFAQAVRANDFENAESILDQIEDRALELKRLKGQ